MPVPGAVPDLGIKGATLRVTFGWRYPWSTFLCARAKRPTQYQQPRPQLWRRWVGTLWGLQPLTRYPQGDHWVPLPDVWVANPHRRLVLFEGRNVAGRDQAVGLSY